MASDHHSVIIAQRKRQFKRQCSCGSGERWAAPERPWRQGPRRPSRSAPTAAAASASSPCTGQTEPGGANPLRLPRRSSAGHEGAGGSGGPEGDAAGLAGGARPAGRLLCRRRLLLATAALVQRGHHLRQRPWSAPPCRGTLQRHAAAGKQPVAGFTLPSTNSDVLILPDSACRRRPTPCCLSAKAFRPVPARARTRQRRYSGGSRRSLRMCWVVGHAHRPRCLPGRSD